MIEFALEQYPLRQTLTNGVQVMIRPLQEEDGPAFTRFHDAIPSGERFLIKHRLAGIDEIEAWCHDQNYEKRLTLLALADGQVAGHATLHQRPGGWRRSSTASGRTRCSPSGNAASWNCCACSITCGTCRRSRMIMCSWV